jgi:hypothetical protein
VAFGFVAHLIGGGVDVAACPDGLSGGNPMVFQKRHAR